MSETPLPASQKETLRTLDSQPTTTGIEKLLELDFGLIKDEKRSRTEFNRRILSLQLSTITALLAAGLFKDFVTFDPFLVQIICCSVMFLNTVFLIEINQNNYYIALAALYLSQVLNVRAGAAYSGSNISNWEQFLYVKRNRSKRILSKLAFFLDAHFFMSILFLIVPLIFLIVSIEVSGLMRPLLIIPYGIIAFATNILGFYRHFTVGSELEMLQDEEEIANFILAYDLIDNRDSNDTPCKRRGRGWFRSSCTDAARKSEHT